MEEVFYRCGWCGFPTDKDGNVLEIGYDEAGELCNNNKLPEKPVNGTCCPEGDGSMSEY